ncbi:MAG TPA: 1-deoxy-D-xylulose-5-phosphate synthase [Candidatus Baltobacteraceae bacterium]|nr:1-deoxy-D-xylulose-5-phosphate synthase [Candidatus Baltobacteraceae bacterium]
MYLEHIDSPQDLKKLERSALPVLAEEMRALIIKTVAKTGGHLASNLGTVELTLALHWVFNSPEDKLVWDVGHQAYPHKLLTGRRDVFPTLRQPDGMSGFTKRLESPHDPFGAGHAGTALSAALGMVAARELSGEKYKVVAVIGDGALTSGLVWEGLNHAGALKRNLLVVLNDNTMSISNNVGAVSAYLNRVLMGPLATRVRSETQHILGAIPGVGSRVIGMAKRVEEMAKGLVTPGVLFEELGFNYVGPIDGHNLEHLITTMDFAARLTGPILLHVVTTKGKGYAPAEGDAVKWHGAAPFEVETGAFKKKAAPITYTEAFAQALIREADEDERILAITAAMAEGTGLVKFKQAHPTRFFDVGIAEQHAVTFAAGLATQGFRPVTAIYSTFLQRGYDQVIHDVCLQGLPVVFALDRAGIVGDDGPTHQGLYDLAFLRPVPNLVILAPKDENDLQHCLKTALNAGGPAAIRFPRGSGLGVPIDQAAREYPLGTAELLRDGDDVLLLPLGPMVEPTLQAAQRLHESGLSAAVVNPRFVKPLDRSLIPDLARRIRRVITIEEHMLAGGFGSAILELFAELHLTDVEVVRLGVPDLLVEQGNPVALRARFGLSSDGIRSAAEALVNGRTVTRLRGEGVG